MGITHRIVLGGIRDAREGAELRLPDNYATSRLINAIDYPETAARQQAMIESALKRLPKADRHFAKQVLNGMTWRDSGITKQGFNLRLKKIIKKVVSPA